MTPTVVERFPSIKQTLFETFNFTIEDIMKMKQKLLSSSEGDESLCQAQI